MIRKEIVKLVDIGEIAAKYVTLTAHGDYYRCKCPFHNGPLPTMTLLPEKGSYRCAVCGAGGDVVDLVMRLEDKPYKDVFEQLSAKIKYEPKGIVYVLELEGGFYYVGYTLDLVTRMGQHFGSQGAHWTRIHRPVRLADVYYDVAFTKENVVTRQYFERYGKERVRGGSFVWC
jgi:predicted GIY-YIG superfamily endonuclease